MNFNEDKKKEDITNMFSFTAEQIAEHEKMEQEKEAREQKTIEETRKRLFYSRVPPRYRDILDPKHDNLVKSTCGIIYGGFGTGKTWEAYAVAKKLLFTGKITSFEFKTEIGLLNELKAGFNDGTFNSRVDRFKKTDLLIVDEVGKSNDSDFNKANLFEILNNRYDWMKKTILICNATEKEELYNIMPTAILDRFRECVILMDGKSLRYKGLEG